MPVSPVFAATVISKHDTVLSIPGCIDVGMHQTTREDQDH
jgi:hypothetical protein